MSERPLHIDINCDLGEGVGNEAQILPLISSCNLACGGHAGSPELLIEILELAKQHGVRAGAHPSYPDRKNFGRRSMSLSKEELTQTIQEQLAVYQLAADRTGTRMHHIKAHGALYNDLAADTQLAEIYLEALEPYKPTSILFAPCGSEFAKFAASHGFTIWEEAFGDRAYNTDGSLVSRKLEGAVLTNPKVVLEQIVRMVRQGLVNTWQNSTYALEPKTICLHGDTPGALEILMYLRRELPLARIAIAK
ncbi:UPF0271 protein [Robiginitalea myxolifaciens]|uniref:UPF0271 protein n=1 Tax=Robiginitalea myxolifaciens TaxID=400055 RepID=A0A1I6H060_9FLAO|nr:5-oxoprolinase subunit PxpA [Robiginitalea myxolifaciens]SFR47849.1 UPF0271 protein [Robiginitalea myxolifaciens]